MSRMSAIAALVAVIVFEALYLGSERQVPRTTLVVAAVALISLGFVARFRGVFLAAAATAVVVIVEFPPWANEEVTAPTTGCDPSCGIGTVGFLIFILPVVIVMASLGALLRGVVGRLAPRHPSPRA